MAEPMKPGTDVTWRWGAHRARGRVEQVFTTPVSRTIKEIGRAHV